MLRLPGRPPDPGGVLAEGRVGLTSVVDLDRDLVEGWGEALVDALAGRFSCLRAAVDARRAFVAALLVSDLPAGLGMARGGGTWTIQAMYHLRRVRTHQDGGKGRS
jgi:hypothetical protein